MTSNPMGNGPTHRRVPGGCHVLIQHPPVVGHNQANYYGLDRAMQYRSKCPVGRQSCKYWKYFMNFIIEVCFINTFLLWQATPGVTKSRKHYSLSDALVDIAESLIGNYSNNQKDQYARAWAVTAAGLTSTAHHSVKLEDRPWGKYKWCLRNGRRRDVVYGCDKCQVHLCQGACFQAYHQHAQLDAA